MPKPWIYFWVRVGVSLVCIETVEDRSLEEKVKKQNMIFLGLHRNSTRYKSGIKSRETVYDISCLPKFSREICLTNY